MIINARDQQQIEALHHFIESLLTNNQQVAGAGIISAFITNGLYQYAMQIAALDVELDSINGAPCSARTWIKLGKNISGQIGQYIIRPIETIVKPGE